MSRDAMEKLDEYLTIKDAAQFLGVSQNTLRYWGRDGRIPVHRNPMNGYRLFRQSDLEAVLKQAAQTPKATKNRKAK
ncbi:MerR family transcriptional regulator [Novipirellula sp. SH528]|uniref:MerR family transcriptional regulator n=1 Tax=Novipirellula sp. SH528 TaxID=3454466 RepID=UPI003FA004FF